MSVRLRSIGPALIVGSAVLGPGSILISSRVGCDFGYDLIWVVVAAAVLMTAMTALSARLGATLDGTIGEVLARRFGRAPTAFVGLVLFLIVACFQFSNNVAVIAALEPLVGDSSGWATGALVILNVAIAVALFGFRRLYRPVEILMKVLVGLMVVGFVGNLFLARPPVGAAVAGLVPSLPMIDGEGSLLAVIALVGTTFSVAGAFYQSYLVRAKGWGEGELRQGLFDSVVGISMLGVLTVVVMITAASVLAGQVNGEDLKSAADVARLLEPTFGPSAVWLFCGGLLAAAFSSFLINVMIGGTVLSDCLGLGGEVDGVWSKRLTVLALLVGMVVALLVRGADFDPLRLVIFAQALTVLGNPILAAVLLWLAMKSPATPRWILTLAWIGLVVVLVLAAHRGASLLGL